MVGLTKAHPNYKGYTDNLQELLNKHNSSTITTYGIHKSRTCNKQSSKVLIKRNVYNKENEQIQISNIK